MGGFRRVNYTVVVSFGLEFSLYVQTLYYTVHTVHVNRAVRTFSSLLPKQFDIPSKDEEKTVYYKI